MRYQKHLEKVMEKEQNTQRTMKSKLFILFAILFLCLQVSIVSAVDPVVENADAVWNSSLDASPTNLTNTASTALPRPLIEYPNTTFNFELNECPEELTDNASKALPRPLIEYPNTAFNFELKECPEELIDNVSKALPRPLVEYPNTVFGFELKECPEELANNASKALPRPLVEYPNTVLSKSLIFPKELINDTTPPIITNITVTDITDNLAMIKWDTDEFANSLVKYGKESRVYTESEEDSLFVKNHTIELTGLLPSTCYYFVVNSTDQSENSAESSEYSFTTSGELKVFDTRAPENPYPSISGTHNGTIVPNQTITVSKLYTYPCPGTGGHTEYMKIWNDSAEWNVTARWGGYSGDWRNISFGNSFTLEEGETYNYTIRTGSYPQIHHTDNLEVANNMGTITCDKFIDANGRVYYDCIPAIRLWS